MRYLAIALAALLAVTAVGRAELLAVTAVGRAEPLVYEQTTFSYEWEVWSMQVFSGPAEFRFAWPGGGRPATGFVVTFGGKEATLSVAAGGTATVLLGMPGFTLPPTVIPMFNLSTADGPAWAGGEAYFSVEVTIAARITDLETGETVRYPVDALYSGHTGPGGTHFGVGYADPGYRPTPYMPSGRYYGVNLNWEDTLDGLVETAAVHAVDPDVIVPGLPEPSSLVLMGLGGLGLVGWRRVRRKEGV
jgi:hypothetical protein